MSNTLRSLYFNSYWDCDCIHKEVCGKGSHFKYVETDWQRYEKNGSDRIYF